MQREEDKKDIGTGFGDEAADHIEHRAQNYCACSRDEIALENEPRIASLKAEGSWLAQHARDLEDRLRCVPPSSNLKQLRRSVLFHWATGIALALAAFMFSLIAFDPFRLGPKAWLYCLGIAIVTPFATERFIETWKSEMLLKTIATAVFIGAITGGALLAVIRGDLLSREAQQSAPVVVIDGSVPIQDAPQDDFYPSTNKLLRTLMVLLTIAIDLGAGIAIHRALELGAAIGEDRESLTRELSEALSRLGAIVFEITSLSNAPATFEKGFWKTYYRSMLTQTARRAMTKVLGVVLCLILLSGGRAFAQERVNIVVAFDLSASEAVKDRDGKTEFQKNIHAVGRLLATVPSSVRITVIGITDHSFADHYVLLSATTSGDAGYFGERLTAARRQLVEAWRRRSTQLQPFASQTDILGALCVAGELFQAGPLGARRLLIVYSDMRNATDDLNLEIGKVPDLRSIVRQLDEKQLVANLQSTSVYVEGVDSVDRSPIQWNVVRIFWVAYFVKAGGNLVAYSGPETSIPLF